MSALPAKMKRLQRRKMHIRSSISGTTERPRLSVRPTLKHIYAQVIDDTSGKTVAHASSVTLKITGKAIAESAKAASVGRVTFDRNGRLYHGRIKALADAAREAGLEF